MVAQFLIKSQTKKQQNKNHANVQYEKKVNRLFLLKCSITERLQFGPDGKVMWPKIEQQRLESQQRAVAKKRRHSESFRLSGAGNKNNKNLRKRQSITSNCSNGNDSFRSSTSSSSTSKTSSSVSRRNSNESNKSTQKIRKSIDSSTYKREYIVEKILAHEVKYKRQMFLVKWQGWRQEFNTWEPLENLTHCPKLLENFLADTLAVPVLDELRVSLQINKNEYDDKAMLALLPKGGFKNLPTRTSLQREILALAATPVDKRNSALRARGKQAMLLYMLLEKRDRQTINLQRWEEEMNVTKTCHAVLKVENDVDLEGPPAGFIYINDYVPGKGIVIPDDPPIGCECHKCNGHSANTCCSAQSRFAYRGKPARINVSQGTPVYECNRNCKCLPENCSNRVVQLGRKVPLCIFRTSNERGWGVRAMRKIHPGEFVCEYVGEVISFEEAERRGRGYDAEGRTYLFDLDFNTKDFPYTVDAATYGNVSHFINHSCNPNLGVWAVWVNCLDPNLPRLALFATREIQRDEEITFDYMSNSDQSFEESKHLDGISNTPSRHRLDLPDSIDSEEVLGLKERPQCKCGASACRRYLF